MPSPRSTFLDAAAVVADLVDLDPLTGWDGPGLGEWDLRALVGHTSRSLITVVEYLRRPATAAEVATPEAYYAEVARLIGADPSAVVERGRAAGAALGDDPAAAFRARLADAAAALDGAGDDDLLTTTRRGHAPDRLPAHAHVRARRPRRRHRGGHGPARWRSPPYVLAEAAALAARIAVELGKGPAVLAALTGGPGCRPASRSSDRARGPATGRRAAPSARFPARHARRTERSRL